MKVYNSETYCNLFDHLSIGINKFYREKLLQFIEENKLNLHRICEIGCGTGNVALGIANKGYDVTAVDISENMINIAMQKNEQNINKVLFLQQDMRELSVGNGYDLVYCFFDGFTYLNNCQELKLVFEKIYDILNPKGVFLFDIFSYEDLIATNPSNIEKKYIEIDNIFTFWIEKYDLEAGKVVNNTTILVKKENNSFESYSEVHNQIFYKQEDIHECLKGKFKIIENKVNDIRKYFYCEKI